jgi:hypothetical protein
MKLLPMDFPNLLADAENASGALVPILNLQTLNLKPLAHLPTPIPERFIRIRHEQVKE